MPPMLYIALDKLPRCVDKDLPSRPFRAEGQQGCRVLELIPETDGAARLVESGPPEEAAGYGLVDQPSIHDRIEGL